MRIITKPASVGDWKRNYSLLHNQPKGLSKRSRIRSLSGTGSKSLVKRVHKRHQQGGGANVNSRVRLVTPTIMTTDQARSDLKRENDEGIPDPLQRSTIKKSNTRKRSHKPSKSTPKRVKKDIYFKNGWGI